MALLDDGTPQKGWFERVKHEERVVRSRLAAVCCQAMAICGNLLDCSVASRGISPLVPRTEPAESTLVFAKRVSVLHRRGPGRIFVGGAHGGGRSYPEDPVFKCLMSREMMPYQWSAPTQCTRPAKMMPKGAQGMSWSTMIAFQLHEGAAPRAQGKLCCQH